MSQSIRVLIVEDNPDDATLLLRELKRAGFEATAQRVDTEDAFVANLQPNLDIILSDYSMPDFDGMRALSLLKGTGMDIPFIIVSGNIGEEIAVDAVKAGAVDYLLKDRLVRLGPAVHHALEQRRHREQRRRADEEVRRAQEAVRESEANFRQLAENINEVFWMTDPTNTTTLYVSPAFERIWGRPCESLYQSPASWLNSIHSEDRERVTAAAKTKMMRGEYDEVYRIVRPDGSVRWIHDRSFPVRNEAGDIYRIVGTAEDITKRKETEQQLRQAQKMECIGQLAGGVAHDFNNILTVIQANVDIILLTEAGLSHESKDCLGEVAHAAERAAGLTRQLVTFSRSEALHFHFVKLNDLTAGFTKMLRRIVGENIRVTNEFAETPPTIRADPGMIEQVLMNLAVNARDAMPNGGQLIIGTELVAIDEARAALDPRTRPGHFACLSVRDTGTGIAPENMARIFEPFFTTKEVGKGTGLGLATVFGIAESHNGWIDVSSELGVGTTFRVFFPLCSETMTASELSIGHQVPGGTEKIFVVEDDRAVRNSILGALENYGYVVVEADSAASAQEVWDKHRGQFDLLITDMVMPGVTGLELLERLRSRKPDLKVMLTSGYSANPALNDLARSKSITFLDKPFTIRILAHAVRKCLDAR